MLQRVMMQLTRENVKLKQRHERIVGLMVQLVDVDLMRASGRYKEVLNEMRVVVGEIGSEGYSRESMRGWLRFLDNQLYKILLFQYKSGMERVLECIESVRVEVVVRSKVVQYKPGIEDVRMRMYRELKKYVGIPSQFKGLSDEYDFGGIVDECSYEVCEVYRRAESVINQVLMVPLRFKKWVLSLPEEEELMKMIDLRLETGDDFVKQLKFVKDKGRELESVKFSFEFSGIKVECVEIKNCIERNLQVYYESVLKSLRNRIGGKIAIVEEFVGASLKEISIKPSNFEEISRARSVFVELKRRRMEGLIEIEEIQQLNKILKQSVGSFVNLSEMFGKWERLEIVLNGYEIFLQEQVMVIRDKYKDKLSEFCKVFEEFVSKWRVFEVPRDYFEEGIEEKVGEVEAFVKEFYEIEGQIEILNLKGEGENRDVEKSDKKSDGNNFEFNVEPLQSLELSRMEELRGRINELKEIIKFSGEIKERLEVEIEKKKKIEIEKEWRESRIEFIKETIGKIDKFQKYESLLKGEEYTRENWIELSNLIKIKYPMSIREMIMKIEVIEKERERIRELNKRVVSESVIKKSLEELDDWGIKSCFVMKQEGDYFIVKEWREVLTMIGDNQSLIEIVAREIKFNVKLYSIIECSPKKVVIFKPHLL
ncbi:hypothetical protein ROZALSC1DRAFT_25194 [Rozella allomycis CSF55]|uniref:Uncharacterized protein n=1 Tax=Rozella allomycis (strain CSF55) TaxID=988480 RepID=A0A4V1IZ18_ROZAC|nr:hypothetical protein ROZALSC1DRAFT_25194 [Rozella allomycis CSF55]